jgi:hypothetical protein
MQSHRDRGVVTGAQSQNQPFRVFGTRESPRKRDGETPHSARDLQIVYDSDRVLGHQPRKTVFGPTTDQTNVGLVDNRAYNGDRERNTFNFRHFSLKEIGIYLDGQLYGLKPLKLDFAVGRYVAAYAGLFGGTNKINRDEGNGISRTNFCNGYALYANDLTPDLGEDDHVNLTRQGTARLNLKFGAALAQTVTVVANAEFENLIEIDRNRNIVFDFSN